MSGINTCIAKARMAYERAVLASDTATATASQPGQPVRDQRAAAPAPPAAQPDNPAARTGTRPATRPGLPITEYTDRELAQLIAWISSDTLLRTEDELFDVFVTELGFQRRGSRIRAAFDRALPLTS